MTMASPYLPKVVPMLWDFRPPCILAMTQVPEQGRDRAQGGVGLERGWEKSFT